MSIAKAIHPKKRIFHSLSIQQRLPLLICILLLVIVSAIGIASYIGVKRTSVKIASERLHLVTEQLTSMFGQSSKAVIAITRSAAAQPLIREQLKAGTADTSKAILSALWKLQTDTQSLYVELLDQNRKPVARAGKKGIQVQIKNDLVLSDIQVAPDSCKVGKMYRSNDSLCYPIVATVTDNQEIIGYIIRWRLVFITRLAMEQFSQLLGTNAALYVGNKDGTNWTDMVKPTDAPPVQNIQDTSDYFEYTRPGASPVIAMARPIENTEWMLLLEFSQDTIQQGAEKFMSWILLIGGLITVIGIGIAWLMSRNIIKPLKTLTAATTALAAGDYNATATVTSSDEIGKLALSFNSMAAQISSSQQNLEQKVKDRTVQLEVANKELEAFSYSVSHDLRAPLRAISGYAIMLKEDYADKLDEEAVRITNTIMTNAKMMGQLIDDLIAFSKMGSKAITYQPVDMKALATSAAEELLKQEPAGKYHIKIGELPACGGDTNLLKQVWLNLVGNAIKYSSQQAKPCIKIGGHEGEAFYHYYVKDNGVGFDMQYVHKLFGVFQRLHGDTIYKGTGIGLALVKRIIHKHKGDIRAESTPGNGAAFYFDIPKAH